MLYRIVTLTALAVGGALLAKQMNKSRGALHLGRDRRECSGARRL